MIANQGLDWTIDSAGTGAWHIGSPPDSRMLSAAAERGVDLAPLRARQATPEDFFRFDHIYAMDRTNYLDLEQIQPHESPANLHLFLDGADIPDPYYGGDDGFEHVLDLIQNRLETLFAELCQT